MCAYRQTHTHTLNAANLYCTMYVACGVRVSVCSIWKASAISDKAIPHVIYKSYSRRCKFRSNYIVIKTENCIHVCVNMSTLLSHFYLFFYFGFVIVLTYMWLFKFTKYLLLYSIVCLLDVFVYSAYLLSIYIGRMLCEIAKW